MKAETKMTRDIATCTQETSLAEVARLMAERDCGAVPVLEGQRVAGIVTDRDIVVRSVFKGGDPARLTARDCMTREVYVVRADSSIEDCIATMEHRHVRRLPVVDGEGACVGILSLDALANSMPAKRIGEALCEIAGEQRAAPIVAAAPDRQRGAENYVYGEIMPPFGSPQDLPKEITDGMPYNVIDLYYDSFNRAYKKLKDEAKKEKPDREFEKAAESAAWSAVNEKYERRGSEWVPKES